MKNFNSLEDRVKINITLELCDEGEELGEKQWRKLGSENTGVGRQSETKSSSKNNGKLLKPSFFCQVRGDLIEYLKNILLCSLVLTWQRLKLI